MEESTDINSNPQLSDSKISAENESLVSTETNDKTVIPPDDGDSSKEICHTKSPLASPKSMSDVDEAIEDFVMADHEESNLGELSSPDIEKDSVGVKKPESPDSDLEIVLVDLKASSDDECLIVEDDKEEIIIRDDDSPGSEVSNTTPAKELVSVKSHATNSSQSNNDIKSNDSISKPSLPESKPTISAETTTSVQNEGSTQKHLESSEPTFTVNEPNETVTPTLSETNVKCVDLNDSCPPIDSKLTKPVLITDSTAEDVLNKLLDKLEIEKDKICSKLDSELGLKDPAELEVKTSESGSSNPKEIETQSDVDATTEPKKRKNSDTEEKSDQILKKIRESLTDVEITVLDTEVDECVSEKVSTIVPPEHFMIKTKKSYLDAIARDLCLQAVNDLFKKEIEEEEEVISDLEKRIQSLDETLILFKLEAGKLLSSQQETFTKNNHDPLVHTRTVGVNVKIVRDCDLRPPKVVQQPLPPRTGPSSFTPLGHTSRPQILVSQIVPSIVQRVPTPRLLSRNTVPTPRPRVAAPNVTMTTQALPMAVPGGSRAKAPTSASGGGIIDLTDDESKATAPRLPQPPSQARLLVPLNSFLQVLPNGQTIRQAAVVPPNLGGKNILQPLGTTCFVANNVGGVRGPVLPAPSQMPTTYFVQLPSNSASSALKGMVPRATRIIGIPQATASSAPKPLPGPSTAAPLMLIPTLTHPAPFPNIDLSAPLSKLPPKPSLKGSKATNGIILSWNMSVEPTKNLVIANYQLFAYQEGPGPISPALWKKVGDVQALPLPMACTLTQFTPGHRYYFAVRAVNSQGVVGPYSDPVGILYTQDK